MKLVLDLLASLCIAFFIKKCETGDLAFIFSPRNRKLCFHHPVAMAAKQISTAFLSLLFFRFPSLSLSHNLVEEVEFSVAPREPPWPFNGHHRHLRQPRYPSLPSHLFFFSSPVPLFSYQFRPKPSSTGHSNSYRLPARAWSSSSLIKPW